MQIKIIVNGTNIIADEYIRAFGFIPRVGEELIYKTFRQNSRKNTDKIFDYHLKVENVIYEMEESWNNEYRNAFINLMCSEISKVKIDPTTIDFK